MLPQTFCTVGDFVIVSGGTGLHQFVRIGDHAFIGGGAGVMLDVIPFGMVRDNPAHLAGLNLVGLKRRGFSSDAIMGLKRAYRTLYKSGLMLEEAKAKLVEMAATQPDVQLMVDFLDVSKRGIIR